MRSWLPLASLALAIAPLGAGPLRAAPPERLLVLDTDANEAGANAGALFNVNLSLATDATPGLEVAADAGAPDWEFVSGLALSPADGRAYVTDIGPFGPGGGVYAISGGTGVAELLTNDGQMVDPFSVTSLSDGRIVIADWDADPAGLGTDGAGGLGHGALFIVDPATCAAPCGVTVLSDGTSFTGMPGAGATAFVDPTGVVYDPVADVLYVADLSADPLGLGYTGAVFAVDVATGSVELLSSGALFLAVTTVNVRGDGRVLAVDGFLNDSVVWEIDPTNPDPENNFFALTGGTQYALTEGVTVDADDVVHVVDSGEFDSGAGMFIIPPGVFRVDEGNPDPAANAILEHDSIDLLTPVSVAAVPVPTVTSVSPSVLDGETTVRLEGDGLGTGITYDFGPSVVVASVAAVPGAEPGAAVDVTVVAGCPGGITVNLVTRHPFGGSATLAGAATVAGGGGAGLPCSISGDASCDGPVNGVDLAVLGMSFGAEACDARFMNDADFNEDDVVDGADLAVLATFFGTLP